MSKKINTKILVMYDKREERGGIPKLLVKYGSRVYGVENQKYDYRVAGIWIECKTAADFVGSVLDGSWNNQHYEMSMHVPYSIVIVTGSIKEQLRFRRVPEKKMMAEVIDAAIKRSAEGIQGHVHVLMTESKYQTAALIWALWARFRFLDLVRFPILKPLTFSNKDIGKAVLGVLPNIGPHKAELLMDAFDNPGDVIRATDKEIIDIDGIGKKSLESIRNVFGV